jgi:hypothetical protein
MMPWHAPSVTTAAPSLSERSGQLSSQLGTPIKPEFEFNSVSQFTPLDVSVDTGSLQIMFPETQTQRGLDQECTAFLRYCQTIMLEANSDCVYLLDILQDHASRTTAAQAFYNVLNLCTQNVLRVDQREAFGDIKLSSV